MARARRVSSDVGAGTSTGATTHHHHRMALHAWLGAASIRTLPDESHETPPEADTVDPSPHPRLSELAAAAPIPLAVPANLTLRPFHDRRMGAQAGSRGTGTRTRRDSRPSGFQDRRLRPLGHPPRPESYRRASCHTGGGEPAYIRMAVLRSTPRRSSPHRGRGLYRPWKKPLSQPNVRLTGRSTSGNR